MYRAGKCASGVYHLLLWQAPALAVPMVMVHRSQKVVRRDAWSASARWTCRSARHTSWVVSLATVDRIRVQKEPRGLNMAKTSTDQADQSLPLNATHLPVQVNIDCMSSNSVANACGARLQRQRCHMPSTWLRPIEAYSSISKEDGAYHKPAKILLEATWCVCEDLA